MAKPVLMIHEMNDDILSLPLENYVLTFDDGLYSQYYYYDKIKHINTEKIFFISSGIICDSIQSQSFLHCADAHEKASNGNKEDYMTVAQIKELMQDPMVTIGGHSHSHTDLNSIPKLIDKIKHIVEDTKLMMRWFETTLGFVPTTFCFPHNNNLEGLYKSLLVPYGFTKFYGAERTPV